jgi:hypothetical protein
VRRARHCRRLRQRIRSESGLGRATAQRALTLIDGVMAASLSFGDAQFARLCAHVLRSCVRKRHCRCLSIARIAVGE